MGTSKSKPAVTPTPATGAATGAPAGTGTAASVSVRPPTPPGGRGHVQFLSEFHKHIDAARTAAKTLHDTRVASGDVKARDGGDGKAVDAVVVLGQKLEAGGAVSAILAHRLCTTARYYRANFSALPPAQRPAIVVTGGDTLGCGFTEAERMAADLAIAFRIGTLNATATAATGGVASPATDVAILATASAAEKSAEAVAEADLTGVEVIAEPLALDTVQNAIFTRLYADALGWRRIALITSAFHIDRSEVVFRSVFTPVDAAADAAPRYTFERVADPHWALLNPKEHAAKVAREAMHMKQMPTWLHEYGLKMVPPTAPAPAVGTEATVAAAATATTPATAPALTPSDSTTVPAASHTPLK